MIKKYLKSNSGSFSIYFALAMSTILMGTGVAIDMSGISKAKTEMQNLADSTALAAAIASNNHEINRRQIAMDYYHANVMNIDNIIEGTPSIEFDDTGSEVKVTIRADYNFMMMGKLFSKPAMESLAISNYGGEYVPPFSVAFVFDVSGSMGWRTADGKIRIDTLKLSVDEFFSTLYSEAKEPNSVRNAMSTSYATYNTGLVDSARMGPGDTHVRLGAAAMVPGGGTNSTPGVQHALNELRKTARTQANDWTGYVIFMTDGDNNQIASDRATLRQCEQMKRAGYEVFTVAFGAPQRAKRMLEACSSGGEHFLDASVSSEMTKAFEDIAKKVVKSIVRVKA